MATIEHENLFAHIEHRLPLPLTQPYNSTSAVYENYRSCGGGGARLFGFSGYSSNSSAQFILVFDAATLPADGAAPKLIVHVAAASVFSAYYGTVGRWFERGIVLCNSSTAITKTIGAADTFFDVQYV